MDANQQSQKTEIHTNQNFEKFYQSNQQLFQIIGLKNAKSILQAVWEARNDELAAMESRYQQKIQLLEEQVLKHRIDFEKKYEKAEQALNQKLVQEREQHENRISMLKSQFHEDYLDAKNDFEAKTVKVNQDHSELEKKYFALKEEFQVEKDIWSTGMLERDHDIKNLTETLGKTQSTLELLKEKFLRTNDESKENKVVIEEMIQQSISLNRKIEGLQKSYNSVEKALSVELNNRKRLDDYIEKLELNLENRTNSVDLLTKKYETQMHWLKSEVARLEQALEKSKSYSKKYKEMNSRLSHELMKSEQAADQQSQSYF